MCIAIVCFHTQLLIMKNIRSYISVDIESKLNVHKTFRRGPERLLNAFCTFNLRPVSRELEGIITHSYTVL